MKFTLWKSSDRKILLIAGTVALLLAIAAMFLVDVVPPGARTLGSLSRLREAIIFHAMKHGSLPDDFARLDLAVREPDRLLDEWGRRIQIYAAPDRTVTLSSFGSDGAPGGTGAAADIIGKFQLTRNDEKPPDDWLQKPTYQRD